MRRILVHLLLVALTAVMLSVPAPAHAKATPAAYLAEARKYTNAERTKRSLQVLSNSECLARFARAQAERMAKEGRLYHTENFGAIGTKCGLRKWAENVAQAPSNDTGRTVVSMWMGSKGHRTNILDRDYRQLGMGAVYSIVPARPRRRRDPRCRPARRHTTGSCRPS